jgi:hypothetical protein
MALKRRNKSGTREQIPGEIPILSSAVDDDRIAAGAVIVQHPQVGVFLRIIPRGGQRTDRAVPLSIRCFGQRTRRLFLG